MVDESTILGNEPRMGVFMIASSTRDIWMQANSMIRWAKAVVNSALSPLNLSSAQGNILFHLILRSREMSQEELAQELDIGKAAISRVIDSLEGRGLVARRLHPLDKRARLVGLTEEGMAIAPEIERAYNAVFQIAEAGIEPRERDLLAELLSQIATNFKKYESGSGNVCS